MATVTATFVFADIAGFTALTEAHGDEQAAALVKSFCGAIGEALPASGGSHVKTIGDAVMLRIPTPARPSGSALRIANDLMLEHGAPAVRAGMHHGSAVEHDGDFFGAAVNLAARVVRGGRPAAKSCSPARRPRSLPNLEGSSTESRGRRRLRHIHEPVELFAAAHVGGRWRRRTAQRPGLPDGRRSGTCGRAARARGLRVLLLQSRLRGRVRAGAGSVSGVTFRPGRRVDPSGRWLHGRPYPRVPIAGETACGARRRRSVCDVLGVVLDPAEQR